MDQKLWLNAFSKKKETYIDLLLMRKYQNNGQWNTKDAAQFYLNASDEFVTLKRGELFMNYSKAYRSTNMIDRLYEYQVCWFVSYISFLREWTEYVLSLSMPQLFLLKLAVMFLPTSQFRLAQSLVILLLPNVIPLSTYHVFWEIWKWK